MRFVSGLRPFVALHVALVCLVVPATASAQQSAAPSTATFEAALQVPLAGGPAPLRAQRPTIIRPELQETRRPEALMPLYASLAVLQGLDIHSTRRGLDSGGREANPVMQPFVSNGAAFIAVKAATTAGVIFASERLWKGKNRKAAILLTVITNAGVAAVVAHNYRVAR